MVDTYNIVNVTIGFLDTLNRYSESSVYKSYWQQLTIFFETNQPRSHSYSLNQQISQILFLSLFLELITAGTQILAY